MDMNVHKFAKRASVNFADGISKIADKQDGLKLNDSLETDSIRIENKGVN